jgi:hypothetical protein
MTEITRISIGIEQKILKEIQAGVSVFTPKQVDDYRLLLVAWYQKYSEELVEIEKAAAGEWLALRVDAKSDKAADMAYDATEHGQKRIELKYVLKAIEKMISALKDRMRRLNNEAFHQY